MQPAAAPAGMQPLAPGSYSTMHAMQPQASGIPPHFGAWPATQSPLGVPGTPFLGWDQNMLAQSFNTMTLNPPTSTEWYLDSGATSHMTSDAGNLSVSYPPSYFTPSNIIIGNGSFLPVTSTCATFFPLAAAPFTYVMFLFRLILLRT